MRLAHRHKSKIPPRYKTAHKNMKTLVASHLEPSAISQLQQRHDVICTFDQPTADLSSLIRDREVLVFRSGVAITRALMDCAPDLKLLVRAGCGLDNLDCEYVRKRGIVLRRISEPAAQAVAEMALALMFALARNIRQADAMLRHGQWAKETLEGHLLAGKVLGIVGAGNIGSRLGVLASTMGMEPIGCIADSTPAVVQTLRDKGITVADFHTVLATADFVSVHVPLNDSTRNLINGRALSLMKEGSYLINLARGGVVDETALYAALATGRLCGAALDVHEHEGQGQISPLAQLPNVVLTPHIGASTVETQQQIGVRVVEIIEAFVQQSEHQSEQQSMTVARREAGINVTTAALSDAMVRI
jgi:D-3-phosphoglycerate dehydrogenase / 2-oxoglutarate reductase